MNNTESKACVYCGAQIVVAVAVNGDRVELNAEPSEHGTVVVFQAGAELNASAVFSPAQRDGMRAAGRDLYEPHRASCIQRR